MLRCHKNDKADEMNREKVTVIPAAQPFQLLWVRPSARPLEVYTRDTVIAWQFDGRQLWPVTMYYIDEIGTDTQNSILLLDVTTGKVSNMMAAHCH